jgi:hypothetical protein
MLMQCSECSEQVDYHQKRKRPICPKCAKRHDRERAARRRAALKAQEKREREQRATCPVWPHHKMKKGQIMCDKHWKLYVAGVLEVGYS